MSEEKEKLERAIQNARATMGMEGFEISDELIEFMRSNPSKADIDNYVEAIRKKYKKRGSGEDEN